MIYGFSPHSPEATAQLEAQVLPCRRKGCGCIPYDHKVHSKKAREERVRAFAQMNANAEALAALIGGPAVRAAGLEPAASSL